MIEVKFLYGVPATLRDAAAEYRKAAGEIREKDTASAHSYKWDRIADILERAAREIADVVSE